MAIKCSTRHVRLSRAESAVVPGLRHGPARLYSPQTIVQRRCRAVLPADEALANLEDILDASAFWPLQVQSLRTCDLAISSPIPLTRVPIQVERNPSDVSHIAEAVLE